MSKHAHHEPGKPASAAKATEAPAVPEQGGPAAETSDSPAELRKQLTEARQEAAQASQQLADAGRRARDAEDQMRQYAVAFDKAKTEFAAAKDRMAREYERNLKRDQTKAVSGLLGVLDTLDRSLESVRTGPVGEAFVDGVKMIRSQFEAALQSMGLERFDGLGEPFDPARHQAVTTMPVLDPEQDGRVVHSVSAGCMFGDEVVRPAVVVVGKAAEPVGDLN